MIASERDAANVLRLAVRLGIDVRMTKTGEPAEGHASTGPRGHTTHFPIDQAPRIYLSPDHEGYPDAWDAETLLHEVAHAYLTPPFWEIDEVPEALILLQWERTVARQILSPIGFDKVCSWQAQTEVTWTGENLDAAGGDLQTAWWKGGIAILRRIGAMREREPTFCKMNELDWSVFEGLNETHLFNAIVDCAEFYNPARVIASILNGERRAEAERALAASDAIVARARASGRFVDFGEILVPVRHLLTGE